MSDAERLKSTMTIGKAISLMKNKHSCEMVERHVRALSRIANNNKTGFLLKELGDLCELLRTCADRLHTFPEYEEPLCRIVGLCSLPFLKERSSDENVYAPCVIETMVLLGELAKLRSDLLRAQVARAVSAFYSTEPDPAHIEGLQMTRLSFNATLVERSSIVKSLVEALQLTEDLHTQMALLHTLQLLSTTATNCNHMLSVGAAHLICDALALLSDDEQAVFVCVDILWNLLEHGSKLQVAEQLSSLECISILKELFRELMAASASKQRKQLRNDILMICSLIARECPDAPFVETGFVRDLSLFATFPEECSVRLQGGGDVGHLRLTQDHEDFELKKALICILGTFSSDGAAVKVMSDQKVLRCLLSFVVQNDSAGSDWNPAQFEELQLLSFSCLCSLAPRCLKDYMTCQGNTRILLLMEWCTKGAGSFQGHGNSFHGVGGRGTRLAQLRHCLRLLLAMCSTGDEVVHQDLHEQGAIPILVGLLKNFLDPTGGFGGSCGDIAVLLEVQADVLLILSCLCEMDMHRKELFGGYDGIKLLVQYLKRDIDKFSSGLGHHRLLLAATGTVWCTVVGTPVVEDIFLENEGVFVLLDLLKVCPVNMQNLVLGVLVDLCENPKAIHHVVAWRGSDDTSAWSLLARLWREEEKEMGVPREYMGTLAGTMQPLVGMEQSARGVPPIPTHCPSAAVLDVTENMRAKVFALCSKMGFQYHSDGLSTEDKITLCIVESYLDLKSGEVWYDVAGELAQEGLRPVTPDQECLQEIRHTHEEKAEEVIKVQHELIEDEERSDLDDEQQFYHKLKQSRQMKEKAERDLKEFVNRTSNHEVLKNAKKQQLAALDRSRTSSVTIGDRFHGVNDQTPNVTTFCGRHVSIATTPLKLLAGSSPTRETTTVTN